MKRLIALLMTLAVCVSLCACGDSAKTNTLGGDYDLESIVYEGLYLSPEEMDASWSYVSVTTSGKNVLASMYLTLGDSYVDIVGHLSENDKRDDEIKYKFWVDTQVGDLVDDAEWLYLYYYPDSDHIKICGQDELYFEFAKSE